MQPALFNSRSDSTNNHKPAKHCADI